MAETPKKYTDQESLKDRDNEPDPEVRITDQLVRQLKPLLPIDCFERIEKELDEVEIYHHRVSLKLFAPHINDDLFPIDCEDDLSAKLAAGVRRALSLARSRSFEVRLPAFTGIVATINKTPVGRLPTRISVSSFSESGTTSGKRR